MSEDFLLNIIAVLNEQATKKKIKDGLKGMDNSMYVKVISKLSIALSQKQLKKDLKQLNDLYLQVGADLKIDSALKKKLQGRIKTLQDNISDLQIGVSAKDSNIAKTVTEARNKGQKVANRTSIDFNIEVKKEKAIADLEYMAKKYSKLFSNASASAKYNNILDAAYGITDAKQLSNVRAQIAAFTSELKANNLASQSLGDKWKSLFDRAKDLFSAASAVTLIFSQVKQAVSSFLQLDTAMTNLYKVQDQITSRDQFSGLLTKWNKLAQNLAVTTESLISSMEAWSKIGFDLDMSEQLAEITSIFEKTAEITNEKATSTLISAAQAFTEIDDLGVDDYVKRVEAVGNKINAIGNKYAIDSEGIADGLQNASAALKVAGNDLNETIALITATNKIYQEPSESSNMLKVASMRLRGQVDALEEMGEDAEGVSTDLTKIQQQVYELTGNKVNIFEDDENLKSTYQMILEIGEVFDSLSDRSQADLLEVMFGKQRASAGASLLLNYEELEKIKNDSINAVNSMAEEYSKYMESAEAHITIFKEKLVETYSTFMSGDLIKYTADLGSGILDLVNSTDLLRHGILAVLSLNIGKGITTIGASIASTVKQMNTLGNALQQVRNLPVDKVLRKESLQELGEATKNLTEKNLKLLLSQKQLKDSDKETILSMHNLTDEEAKLKLEKMGLITATKQQTTANVGEAASTNILKGAMTSLKASIVGVGTSIKAAFLSNPIGVVLTAITTIISVATTAISKYNEKLEETRRANIESATTAHEKAEKLRELYVEYTRLASIQDRTETEEESFKTAIENITVALGNKAEALKGLTADTDEYAKALANATKEELQSQAVTATVGRVSAEEELQNAVWDDWKGSKVSIDSNDKGKALSDEAQRAVDIVSDALKEFETINRTWKNISWDISGGDDPVETFEFYNALIKAREDLVLAAENDEALFDTEIYSDLNSAIETMSESLDTYIEQLYEEEKLNYMAQNGIPTTTEEYQNMEAALMGAAGSSVDLQEKFKELLTTDFTSLAVSVEGVGNAVENVMKNTVSLSISDTIDQLNTQLKPAFDSLQSAYQDIFTDDGFALNSIDILSTCDTIKSKLDDLNEIEGITVDYTAFEDLVRVLTNTESTEQDVETAFDSLATTITQAALSGTEDFGTMKSALEDLGVVNSEMVAFDALIKNTEALKEAGLDLSEATYDEIETFVKGIGITENYTQAVNLLKIQKILCAENPLSTTADIQNLYMLAQAAGIATNAIKALMTLNTAYEKASAEGNTLAATAVKGQMELVKKQVMDQFANLGTDVDFSNIGGGTKSASNAGSSAGDAYVDAFEEELKALEDLRSNGLISEKEYLDRLRVLYERYFKDRLGYEKEFAKYQKQYLDGYKSLYESIFSHATKLIGDRIDLIEDEKDKAIDALEAQKKAAEDSYNAQIKLLEDEKQALQDKIDKIKEENEDREEAIDLQKKQLELARAENQKTILQYTEDRGFIYTTDDEAIRDAKNELDSAKADAQIRALEKQQDALDKQIDAIQEMLDASNEYWDAQIEQTENYYDTLIKGMEGYKSRWEELSDLQEHAEMIALLQELGLTEEDLLNESSGAFDRLRTSYLGILKDLNTGNQGVLDGLSQLANVDMGNIPSFLAEMQGYMDSMADMDVTALSDGLNDVSDGFAGIADSASNAASAISGGGVTAAKPNGNTAENGSQKNANNTGNGSSLTEAIGKLAQDGIQEISKISDAFAGEDGEGTSVTDAIQKVIDKTGSDTDESLMSALSEQTAQALDSENGIPAQKTAWEALNEPLNEAVESITTLQTTLEDMDGREFTVTLNVTGNGAATAGTFAGQYALQGKANVEGTANIKGTANAQGNWGVKESGRTLVGELGQELWVHSKDGTFETVGDNGAEFISPEKGDIIFNHLQTRQLLDKGNILSRGKAYAEGSALVNGNIDPAMVQAQRPYAAIEQERLEKCAAALGRSIDEIRNPLNIIALDIKKETGMGRYLESINNISNINNVANNKNSQVINQEIHVTLPNVTNSTSADELLKDLKTLGYKKYEFV